MVAGGPLSAAPQGDGDVVLRHVSEDNLSPVQERMWEAQVLQGTQDRPAYQSERVGFVDNILSFCLIQLFFLISCKARKLVSLF